MVQNLQILGIWSFVTAAGYGGDLAYMEGAVVFESIEWTIY